MKQREDREKNKRVEQKTLLKQTLEQQMLENLPERRSGGYQIQGMSEEEKKINRIKIN